MNMVLKVENCAITKNLLNAADTTQTIPLFEIPSTAYLLWYGGRVKTPFSGVTLPQVKVGYSSDDDQLVPLQRIDIAADLIAGPVNTEHRGFCPRQVDPVKTEAWRTISAVFSSQSGNFSSLSAGEVEFVVVYAA